MGSWTRRRPPRPQRRGPTDRHEGSLGEDALQLGAGPVDGIDLGGVDVCVAVVAHHVAMMYDILTLPVVGGDDTYTMETLGEVGQDVGDAVAHPLIAAFRRSLEPERGCHQ